MSLPKRLYEVQQVDSEFQGNQESLDDISRQLGETEALLRAREEFLAEKSRLVEVERYQKDVEWEVEDLQNSLTKLRQKLYSGGVKIPKELLNLEHEVESLRDRLRRKEDIFLDLMTEAEAIRASVKVNGERVEKLELEWRQEQEVLMQRQTELRDRLSSVSQKREMLTSQISPQALSLYEAVKSRKGQAVAKVEQGRCQGCRITLPMSEWRRTKAGDLVQCSSCGRILYLG